MQSGQILRSRYQIIKFLGSGGFGETHLAQDLDLPGNPKCVVKHLKPKSLEPEVLDVAKKLFEREAKTLYQLGNDSNQIPKLFAHFQEGREFYLVQEYIEGQDISRELSTGKKISEFETIALLKGILEALVVAHKNNIIHRDIKPQNLMRRKSDKKIILIDFGAVKEIGVLTISKKGLTSLTIAVGTPGYMPSEQSNGKPKLSSDIYAVGMVGIKALTGKDPDNLPVNQDTGNIIWQNEAQVSNHLANILDRMVHEYFPQRYQNAMEVLEVLSEIRIKASSSGQGKTPTVKVNTPRQGRTSRAKTTVKVNPPKPKISKTRRRIFILGGLAGSGVLVALTKYFSDMGTSKQYTSRENNPIFSPETLKENVSIPEPTPLPTPSPQPRIPIQIFTFVKVDSRGEIISRTQGQAEVMTENIGNGISLEMVKIPGGRFLMGSPETEAERSDNEGPQHYVDVPQFFMGKYVVTQAQWQAVMGNNPSRFKGTNRPVEQVNWYDATEFCQNLSKITGRTYRLPSEAEWEYACRAGTTTPFYFGETINTDLANYHALETYANEPKGEYREETTPVGQFPSNSFGLYDMHGNVWEWCADEWHENYDGAPTDGSVWLNGDKQRSPLRGGSWDYNPNLCRSAIRGYYYRRGDLNDDFGFRLVCDGERPL